MNVLVIVNGPPYGSELPYNALRLARELAPATASTCACSS